MPKQIHLSDDVKMIIRESRIEHDRVILPQGQMDRDRYVAFDKAMKALGGKWDRASQAHKFPKPCAEMIAEALADGQIMDRQKTFEQFFTDSDLAERMASIAQIGRHDIVLEPSAGQGALVAAAWMRDANVIAVDIDPEMCLMIESNLSYKAIKVECADFMKWQNKHVQPSAVLMNPPFSGNQDIKHVRRAWDMLAKGGRLVAIISAHSSFAMDRASVEFRDWAKSIGGESIPLPAGSFKAAGTMVYAMLFHAANKQD